MSKSDFFATRLLEEPATVPLLRDKLGFGAQSAFIAMFRFAFGIKPGRYLVQQ